MKRRPLISALSLMPWMAWAPSRAQGPIGPEFEIPARVMAQMLQWTGGAQIEAGGVRLEIPELVDNGHDVPMRVSADTAPGHPAATPVQRLSIWATRNPQALVLDAEFGPLAAKPELATRIRLATSQTVLALARHADGTVRSDRLKIVVALAACVES